MVPASTVHAFRIESGRAKWHVAAEWATLAYQIEGSLFPSGPWTSVATDTPGVGDHFYELSAGGKRAARKMVLLKSYGNGWCQVCF
jgi:hypothetical protein